MERKITIPTLNEGKEFEVPKRKVKHTRYILEKTAKTPTEMVGYETGYHTAFIMLKSLFKDIKYDDIDELEDDMLTKLNNIVWGSRDEFLCPKCKYKFKREDFRKAGSPQKPS